MGDPGQQHGAIAVGLFDILRHLVEGPIYLGDLRRPAGVQQAHRLAATDTLSGAFKHLQRVVELAHQQPGRGGGQHADQHQPGHHQPDALAAQRVGVERHLQPIVAVDRLMNPDRRVVLGLYPHLGLVAQFVAQLVGEDAGVGPVHLTLRDLLGHHHTDTGHFLDVMARGRAAGPIGADQHRSAVTVLAVHQQVFVTQQVQQGQHL